MVRPYPALLFLCLALSSGALLSSCGSAVRYSSVAGTRSAPQQSIGSADRTADETPVESQGRTFRGKASYYADKFHGRTTASGEVFDQAKMTAAHRELPFGTVVHVTNLLNQRSITVRINDRGPFIDGRIIDLSRAAAEALGMIEAGVVPVEITIQ